MKRPFRPAGPLSLGLGGGEAIEASRIALLEQIRATGSITKAGKAVGISYRTAWLAVDHLNELSDTPLVERSQGGKSGGGTRLTAEGGRLIEVYRALETEHRSHLDRMREGIADFDRFQRLARKLSLKTSARNQLFGTVESIRARGLDSEVTLRLKGKNKIVSRITRGGLESLGIAEGGEAYALIKANWINIAQRELRAKSEGNALAGHIRSAQRAAGKAEVLVELSGGSMLVAMVPDSGWEPGSAVSARFRAEDVILGVAV